MTHYPATARRRGEYRMTYLRATGDGASVVTVRPDGALAVASVTRAALDARRRGALLYARGPGGRAPASPSPTLSLERERERLAARITQAADAGDRAAASAAFAELQQVRARYRAAWRQAVERVNNLDPQAASPQARAVLREAQALLTDPDVSPPQRTLRLRMIIERPLDPLLARSAAIQPVHAQAVERWTQYVSPALARHQPRVRLVANPAGRAAADRRAAGGAELNVTPDHKPHVVIHELGHTVEFGNDELFLDAAAFLRRRQTGIGTLDADGPYVKGIGRGEVDRHATDLVAWKEAYLDRYAGRLYKRNWPGEMADRRAHAATDAAGPIMVSATEVVSVGLERLATDPVGFARRDWDYFRFIVRRVLWRE